MFVTYESAIVYKHVNTKIVDVRFAESCFYEFEMSCSSQIVT